MKQKMKQVICSIFVIVAICAKVAYCVEIESIPVSLNVKNEEQQDTRNNKYTFVLTAKDNAPLPEGSEDGAIKLDVNTSGEYSFGKIEYEEPGDYYYEVTQINRGDRTTVYDDSKYMVIVSVLNDNTMNDLITNIVIAKEGTQEKYPSTVFNNTFFLLPEASVNTADIDVFFFVSLFVLFLVVFIRKFVVKERE